MQSGFDMPAKGQRVDMDIRLCRRGDIKPSGCIEWTGVLSNKGYGVLKVGAEGRTQAHRACWELNFGPVPHGMCVLHKCDNPACFNPKHLFLGTKGDNNRDRSSKGRNRNQWTGPLEGRRLKVSARE